MFKVVSTYYPSGSTFSPLGYFCALFPIYPEIRVLSRLRGKHVKLSPKTIKAVSAANSQEIRLFFVVQHVINNPAVCFIYS